MKKLIAALGLILCTVGHAKEVVLDCNGIMHGIPIGPVKLSYQIAFDDDRGLITSMEEDLWEGCFPSETRKSTKCDCAVTPRQISCDSSFIGGKDGGTVGHKFFTINRYTGTMVLVDQRSSKGTKDRKAYAYIANAELQCEAITAPKF